MFRHLSIEEREAVLGLCIACLSVEDGTAAEVVEDGDERWRSWRDDFMLTFLSESDLQTPQCRQLLKLEPTSYEESEEKVTERKIAVRFNLALLCSRDFDGLKLFAALLVDFIEIKKYDSRGSVLLRNIAHHLKLSSVEKVWLAHQFCHFVDVRHAQVSHDQTVQADRYRYAKIGAVAVGAGALVFFTAGLVSLRTCSHLFRRHGDNPIISVSCNRILQAAPAVAGALIMMGTSSAAAIGIAGSMVIIFGGTGAGLAGYKMKNRTTGLTDFAFKQYDEKVRPFMRCSLCDIQSTTCI